MGNVTGPPQIPTTFRRFDSRVTEDDNFINIRDLFTARENVNILLARRARWPLFTITCNLTAADLNVEVIPVAETGGAANIIHRQFVRIPYYAPSVQIAIYGKASAETLGPYLYPFIQTDGLTQVQVANGVEHADGTTLALTQLQLDIPSYLRSQVSDRGYLEAWVGVALECNLDGTDGDPETVIRSGPDWVETSIATPGFAVGDYMYVTSEINRTLRRVTYVSDTGSVAYYRVAQPWGYIPQKDDTVNAQSLVTYTPDTITAWADRGTAPLL